MPEFEIGFSPCPNDTFIFDALVNHKIDTKGYTFKVHLQDVQTLNEWAIAGKLPFSKISYGVWPLVKNNYALLNSGGALGKGVGPLLVYKEDNTRPEGKPDASTMRVAIPGVNTTAHLRIIPRKEDISTVRPRKRDPSAISYFPVCNGDIKVSISLTWC